MNFDLFRLYAPGALQFGAIFCLSLGLDKSISAFLERRAKRRLPVVVDPLDLPLFPWNKVDHYTTRQLLQSVAIFGASGSGKSSGSGLLFARAALSLRNSSGLIRFSKPEDRAFWIERFKEQSRLNDLIIFGPNEPARCNFIDFEMQSGGDSRSLTEFMMVTCESVGKSSRGENRNFWEQSKRRLLFNTIELCRLAWGSVSVPDIQAFITTAYYHPSQLSDKRPDGGGESPREKWRNGKHFQTVIRATQKDKTAIEQHDFNLCTDYWANEFPNMDEKARSSILADVLNLTHTYNTGVVREIVSTTTNVSPAIFEQSRWVLIDFPLDVHDDSGRIIMSGWKYLTQKFILRRHVKPDDPVIIIHADEAQTQISSFHGDFLAKSRSHHGCMIYLTQSLHSYFGEAHGQAGEHKAKALLTNFGLKVFHTVGDLDTAQYASSLLGDRLEEFTSWTAKPSEGPWQDNNSGGSISRQYQPVLRPISLLTGLRNGGANNGFSVDGYVIKGGLPFASNSENYLRTTFDQR